MKKQHIKNYLSSLIELEQKLDAEEMERILQCMEDARENGSRIFVFGNGGSAAHANHFACDLGKNVTSEETGRFYILSICENMASITAYANDIGYESVFAEQLKNYGLGAQDVLFAVSASGNSPNVVKACEYAKQKGAKVLSMTGFSGGRLKQLSDLSLHVPVNEYEKVEDIHMAAMHIIVSYFKGKEAK